MMWFRQRKPRRFEHRMIYADDRKKFLTSHLRRKETGQAHSFIFMGIVLLALIAVILYLLNS